MREYFEDNCGRTYDEQWRRAWTIELPVRRSEPGPDGLPITPEDRPEIMKIYDITPDEQKHVTPVILVPGWAGTADSFRQIIFSLADYGWRTLGVTAVHGITPTEDFPGMPVAEIRKMNALLLAITMKELDVVNLAVHSEGALFSTLAATAHPERIKDLLLDSPAGLIGQDNWQRLLTGFTQEVCEQMLQNIKDKKRAGLIKDSFACIQQALAGWKNKDYSIAEVQAILGMEIGDLLAELKRQGHGIVVIHHTHDREFPIHLLAGSRNKKTGQTAPGIVRTNMVDGFISMDGHHLEMLRQPKLYAAWINHIFCALENRKKVIVAPPHVSD